MRISDWSSDVCSSDLGTRVFPVTTTDLEQIFSAKDRPHVRVGTVYPSVNVAASLFIDAMLGKHFALLGSTGTGKSTATALILHRICEMAPEGHVVMLDPHGESSAAFKNEDRKSTRLNSSHYCANRMPSSS